MRIEPALADLQAPSALAPEPASASATPKVCVIVASRGRPVEMGQLLEALAEQSLPAWQVILSVSDEADLPARAGEVALVVMGEPGSCAQRNRGLALVNADIDIVAFFDDDYLPHPNAVASISAFYRHHPAVVAAHGQLLADGINGPGLSYEASKSLIAAYDAGEKQRLLMVPCEALYGCNMTYRAAAIGNKRFDERLPLYGWQEDIDFSNQFVGQGAVVSTNAFVGVHRGVKTARTSGRRFGYSQIVNPAYLVTKGTMRARYAAKICLRNLGANIFRAFTPEPWVDRRGRLIGNMLGLWSLLQGPPAPEKVLDVR